MRSPKGFGKHYFSLAAIQAYSVSACNHGILTTARQHTRFYDTSSDDTETIPPDEEPCELLLQEQPEPSSRACHCNRIFHRRTCAIGRRVRFNSRYRYDCRKTKTGVAPPSTPFFSSIPSKTRLQGIHL